MRPQWSLLAGRLVLIVALVLPVLSGCSSLPSTEPAGLSFSGIASAPHANEMRVLFIHGMGVHDRSDPDTLLLHLTKALHLQQVPPAQQAPPFATDLHPAFIRPTPRLIHVHGAPAPAELYRYEFSGDGGTRLLHFSFLLWSPMTTPIKDSRLAEGGRTPDALVNRWAKQFIRENLSDVVLYGGTYRQVLRPAVEKALCYFVDGTPDDDRPQRCLGGRDDIPTAVVTHSLGAYMLMDATDDLSGDDVANPRVPLAENAALKAIADLQTFDWLANQLALLSLTTLTDAAGKPVGSAASAIALHPTRQRFLAHLRYQRQRVARLRGQTAPPPVRIVAVTDPEDVLSYVVSPIDIDDPSATLFNVFLSNGEWDWFGLVADPFNAHLGYLGNDDVMQIITCGMQLGMIAQCNAE